MFELSRLAPEHLADAYAQVVPLRRRSSSSERASNLTPIEYQRRDQA